MLPCFRRWLLLAWIAVWSNVGHSAATDLTVLPQDGRSFYTQAIDSARSEIRIEICVLEDPGILSSLQAALRRGVRIRAIVDQGVYAANTAEQANLATYLTAAGGELHLSNPIFPRSFPKIILIDRREFLLGSACLDSTTFAGYRDFALRRRSMTEFNDLARLFENDWAHSAPVGQTSPTYNPTPAVRSDALLIAPVNAGQRLVSLYRQARKTLDVYSELLGNPTLESELAAAVARGVRVRLISPIYVNNLPESVQQTQITSLNQLKASGVTVHVSGPAFDAQQPYMHARADIVDGRLACLGSISLSPDSITFNREAGIIVTAPALRRKLARQFEHDFRYRTRPY